MKQLSILAVILFTYDVYCSSISEQKCGEYSELIEETREDKDLLRHSRRYDLPGKVQAEIGEFPHMVKLGYEHDENDTRRITWGCGGILISDEFILTAASCRTFGSTVLFKRRRSLQNVESREKIPENLELSPDDSPVKFIKLGDKTKDEQILTVKEIILHPNMNPPSLYNDIALLKLSKKVNFTEFIRPACLYSANEDLTNKSLIATGWGLKGFAHYFSDDLMKLDLTVFSEERCKMEYSTIKNVYFPKGVIDTQMCVGSYDKPKSLCPGDGGGPVQKRNEKYSNMYDIVGIISFGYYCNLVKISVLATNVTSYIPWIENIVWNSNI